ncbi:50S ribosomal protein L32e [archaeon]|nr:50S ribosomal protein L32e [archaeon]
MSKRKPEFKRVDYHRYKKLRRSGWRKPKGVHNKARVYKKGKALSPSIGYGNKSSERGKHPSGYFVVLVSNEKELVPIDKETQAVMFSATLGKRKKSLLYTKALELGLKVLNPPKDSLKED